MCLIAIMSIITIITIIRIIVGFQGWDEGTLEGLGASVRHSRSGEQEQYTSIPDWIETTKAPLSIPGGHIMTRSNRWLPWNGFAGNGLQYTRCTPLYLVCPITRQLNRPNAPCVGLIHAVPMFLGEQYKCIMHIMQNYSKSIFVSFFSCEVIPTLRTQIHTY